MSPQPHLRDIGEIHSEVSRSGNPQLLPENPGKELVNYRTKFNAVAFDPMYPLVDGITAAVINVGMERQAQQMNANAALVREARRSDAAVLQLLDAAKSMEGSSNGQQNQTSDSTSSGKGSILNIIA